MRNGPTKLLLALGFLCGAASLAATTGEIETQDMNGKGPADPTAPQVLVAPAQKPASNLTDPFQNGGDRTITSVLDLSFEPTEDGRWRITFVKPGSKAADKYHENQLVSEVPSIDDDDASSESPSRSTADAVKVPASHLSGSN